MNAACILDRVYFLHYSRRIRIIVQPKLVPNSAREAEIAHLDSVGSDSEIADNGSHEVEDKIIVRSLN